MLCAVRFAVIALVCVPLACATGDAERSKFIGETLRQRAKHVKSADRDKILEGLLRAERRTEVDALLLLAVAEEESHFKRHAKSRRGALGLMQIRPATGRDVCKRNGIPWNGEATLFDPSTSLLIGATYLAELRERFGSWDLALTAYNEGPTRAKRAADRKRHPSSRYAVRVLKRYETFRQAAGKVADSS
jgi:soluble lytic murein transglycosylase